MIFQMIFWSLVQKEIRGGQQRTEKGVFEKCSQSEPHFLPQILHTTHYINLEYF
jgi:hypothetical protein